MLIADDVILEAVARYERERDRYIKLAGRVADLCRNAMEENVIRAQVTSRTKTLRSFEGKLRRFSRRQDKNLATIELIFQDISDFAGVRIATYQVQDEAKAAEIVSKIFCGPAGGAMEIDPKDKLEPAKGQFYRSTHCQVFLRDDELLGDYANLRGASCEIQICSMMAHVWNEIEHDIGYKPDGKGPSEAELGLLETLGHLTRAGDAAITRLLDANVVRMTQQQGDFVDIHDFVARLRQFFPNADLSVNAGPAFDAANMLNLTSAEQVKAAIGPALFEPVAAKAEIDRFNDYLHEQGQSELTLNAGSGDLVLIGILAASSEALAERLAGGRAKLHTSRLFVIVQAYRDFLARGAKNGESV